MSCSRPYILGSKDNRFGVPLYVPCGSCASCKKSRSFNRFIRAMFEAQNSHAYFLTLTYDDEHLGFDESLDTRDFQLFMKKLRNEFPNNSLKYIMCGEYGENNGRKHYHAILFGLPLFHIDKHSCTYCYNHSKMPCNSICKCWNNGLIQFTPATSATLSYVVGYVDKKIYDTRHFENYGLRRQFVYSSRNLGLQSFKNSIDNVVSAGGVRYQNKVLPLPSSYKKYLERIGLYGKYLYNRVKVQGFDIHQWIFEHLNFSLSDKASLQSLTTSREDWNLKNPTRSRLQPLW